MIEDEMVGWHHRLYGHEFEQTLGDGEGQGSLACHRPWAINWERERVGRFGRIALKHVKYYV